MKIVYGVVLLASCLALALAFPGATRKVEAINSAEAEKNDRVDIFVPIHRDPFVDVLDDFEEPWNYFPSFQLPVMFNPFNNFYKMMQEMIDRFKGMPATTLYGDIPEGGNTTSTTKIINNHKVTINETTYFNNDDAGSTGLRVRIVNVQPLDETTVENVTGNDSTSTEGTNLATSTASPKPSMDREEITSLSPDSVETVEEFSNFIPKDQVDTLTA